MQGFQNLIADQPVSFQEHRSMFPPNFNVIIMVSNPSIVIINAIDMLKIPNMATFGKFHQYDSIWYPWDSNVVTNLIDPVSHRVD